MKSEAQWMLVDDQAEILFTLSILARSLTSAAIECHPTPESALAAFAAAPGGYELIITDFEMPGMNGQELARHIHEISPAQRIVLSTGSGSMTAAAARSAGFGALLKKPLSLTELENAIAEAGLKKTAETLKPAGVPVPIGGPWDLSGPQLRLGQNNSVAR